ncbi:MAG: methyl-accepting chemotaxis protein [Acidobacteria bacterium]|nr:methyl-accepting chemotaxis protein [Acidobacteriota bacterium]
MLKQFALKVRILILSGTGAALALLLGLMAWWALRESEAAMSKAMVYMQAIRNQTDADMMHDAIRSDVLESQLLADGADAGEVSQSLTEHVARMAKAMRENHSLPVGDRVRSLVSAAEEELNHYSQSSRRVLEARSVSRAEIEARKPEFEQRFKTLEGKMEALSDSLEQSAVSSRAEAEAFFSKMKWVVGSLTGLVVGVLVLIAVWLSSFISALLGRLTGRLASSLETVNQVSQKLASSSSSLAANQQEQAAAIAETSATSDSVSRGVVESAQQSRQVSNEMRSLNTHMSESSKVVHELEARMTEIESANRNVSEIMKVLDSIAFQTNILALNASIEAARAGQAGAGFAVVADEVRALAQRAADASHQISGHVNESLEKASQGSGQLGLVLEAFAKGQAATERVNQSTASLETESNRQADSLKEVAITLRSMAGYTAEAANRASTGSQMSADLSQEVVQLDEVFREVIELVGQRG